MYKFWGENLGIELVTDSPNPLELVHSNILYFQDSQPAFHPGFLRNDHPSPCSLNALNQRHKCLKSLNSEKYRHEDHNIAGILEPALE